MKLGAVVASQRNRRTGALYDGNCLVDKHPLTLHSDSGGQYCSHSFEHALAGSGMLFSMSRKVKCWGNAPIESLWGSLKVGRL